MGTRATDRFRTAIAAACMLLASPAGAQQAELVVSPDGPLRSIGEALRSAPAGAHIRVRAGTYVEPALVIERPVTLEGEPGAIIDGSGEAIILIAADDVTVQGLTFRNVATSFVDDRAAIRAANVRDCTIRGNTLEDTFFGIYLAGTTNCRIENNRLIGSGTRETTSGNGIHAWSSRGVTVLDNDIRGHRDGIYFEFVRAGHVEGNTSEANLRYGLHFMFSDSCRYTDNQFIANGAGVAVMYARAVLMEGNAFASNRGTATYGLLLKDIRDSQITDNRFDGNTVGLLAEGSNRLVVRSNAFRDNGWAVKVMANAEDNRFTDNLFIANTFDVATNSTRTRSAFDSNYWDAYAGYDLDRDGFGDVPFRPVRLFSLVVERHPPALVLLRSLLTDLLDAAERVLPVLTPAALIDEHPRMTPRGAGPRPDGRAGLAPGRPGAHTSLPEVGA